VEKLTDNEIVKALEWCKIGECRECAKCVPNNNGKSCRDNLLDLASDLINRQNAELERKDLEIQILIRKKEALKDEIADLTAEVERYEKIVGTLATQKDGTVIATLIGKKTKYIPNKLHEILKNMAINRAKAEAIKEFAEMLKARYLVYDNNVGAVGKITLYKDIDNLVKEMVGD
jgi:hypothetical protein